MFILDFIINALKIMTYTIFLEEILQKSEKMAPYSSDRISKTTGIFFLSELLYNDFEDLADYEKNLNEREPKEAVVYYEIKRIEA